jgi:hypothetical protein
MIQPDIDEPYFHWAEAWASRLVQSLSRGTDASNLLAGATSASGQSRLLPDVGRSAAAPRTADIKSHEPIC